MGSQRLHENKDFICLFMGPKTKNRPGLVLSDPFLNALITPEWVRKTITLETLRAMFVLKILPNCVHLGSHPGDKFFSSKMIYPKLAFL